MNEGGGKNIVKETVFVFLCCNICSSTFVVSSFCFNGGGYANEDGVAVMVLVANLGRSQTLVLHTGQSIVVQK